MLSCYMEQEGKMSDLIDRQAAMDAVLRNACHTQRIYEAIKGLPSAQTKMIKEIREWINSKNRGSSDYFIVDKIEEIINKYE